MKNKTNSQKINELVSLKKTQRNNYDIEIVSINKIKNGVEVFVRAWVAQGKTTVAYKNDTKPEILDNGLINGDDPNIAFIIHSGEQIGFGKVGTVDIERFIIINPPILVPDDNGDIIQIWIDENKIKHTRKLREDTKEAILQIIEQALDVKKEKFDDSKIVKGKIGNTTSIF